MGTDSVEVLPTVLGHKNQHVTRTHKLKKALSVLCLEILDKTLPSIHMPSSFLFYAFYLICRVNCA